MGMDEALGIYAEAAQDMASAGLAFAAGNFYDCADLSNQVAEKVLQAVYLTLHDARAHYDHDLLALGRMVGVPSDLASDLVALGAYHPAQFLAGHDAETLDDAVGPEAAETAMRQARGVLRWARHLVLSAS